MSALFQGRLGGLVGVLFGLTLLVAQGCGGALEETGAQGTGNTGGGGGGGGGIGVAQLSWDAPTDNSDGTPLTDTIRYRVYVAQMSPVSQDSGSWITVEDATSHTFTGLPPGVYYFAVSAVNMQGAESGLSNEVEKVVL